MSTRLDKPEKDDPLEIVQEIKILPYYQMVYAENEAHKTHWDVEIQTNHQAPACRLDLMLINKEKNFSFIEFYRSGGPQSENKRKRTMKHGPCHRTKKKICGTCG